MAKNKKENSCKNETHEVEDKTSQQNEQTSEPSELEVLTNENLELNEKLLRQAAEFDNFKKRTTRERSEVYANAISASINEFLDVVDNFTLALQCETTDAEFKKGIEMIYNQFLEKLSKMGVQEINPLNEPFNPEFHNAVSQIEDENFGENVVSQVFKKGYKVGDKVIKPAMVVVANPNL